MSALMYGIGLQLKLDMRSKTMLITCYLVPLIFFAFMGGIFISINPEARYTLIQSMTVFGVSMAALNGLPPPLVEIYGSGIKNVYKANGVPLHLGVVTHFLSAFIHLLIMCTLILVIAPIAFNAAAPANLPLYFCSLAIFVAVSLSIGSVLGLLVKSTSKLTMISQIIFLPSIMLSGIMFPIDMLPKALETVGKMFPATWGYKLMMCEYFDIGLMIPLLIIFAIGIVICGCRLSRIGRE